MTADEAETGHRHGLTRRQLLGGVGAVVAAATFPSAVGPPAMARAAAARLGGRDPLGLRAELANPSNLYRPGVFWWWPGAEVAGDQLDTEVRALKEAGFGAAQIIDLEGGPASSGLDWQWGTRRWFDSVNSAVRSGLQHDLRIDIPLYPIWPMSSPTATLDNGLSAQALHVGQLPLVGPQEYVGPVPDAVEKVGYKTLEAVSAAREQGLGADGEVLLDSDSVVDLTGTVQDDGTMRWSVPPGRWLLFGFWRRPTGQLPQSVPAGTALGADAVASGAYPEHLLVIDPFSKEATRTALDWLDQHMMTPEAVELWRANAGELYEDSFEYHVSPEQTAMTELLKDLAEGATPVRERGLDAGSSHRHGTIWSPAVLGSFATGRGYSLVPYLPALFHGKGGYDFTEELGARVRSDFHQTLTDLIIEHQTTLREWAEDYGFSDMRHQSYGLPIDSSRAQGAAGGIPDTESLEAGYPQPPGSAGSEGALDMYRVASGAAHIYGSDHVNLEAGDVLGLPNGGHIADPHHPRFWLYGQQPRDYWQIINHGYAGGITRIQLHGLSYRILPDPPRDASWLGRQGHPWPGWSAMYYFFSESWNHTWPQWKFWSAFSTYMGRAAQILSVGRPRVDLLVYRDDVVPFGIPVLPGHTRRQELVRAGFTYEFTDPVTLAEHGEYRRGRLFPDGPGYRAVIIDRYDIATAGMPGATAIRLERWAREGLPVVFVGDLPDRGTGAAAPAREDAQVRAAVAAMVSLPNVRQVSDPAQTRTALTSLGVEPDAGFDSQQLVRPVHRATETRDYWYLWNEDHGHATFTLTLQSRGTPYRVNLWDNETSPVGHYSAEVDRLRLPLSLGPHEAAVLVVDHSQPPPAHVVSTDADRVAVTPDGRLALEADRAGRYQARSSDGRTFRVEVDTLPAPLTLNRWDLHVDEFTPEGSPTHDLELTALKDWRDIPELRRAAGTGIYTATIEIPDNWLAVDRGVRLSLGTVHGASRVAINGREVTQATVRLPEDSCPVAHLLRPGKNTVTVALATPPRNKLVGLAEGGDPRYAYFAMTPAQPSGLLGPVMLTPYGVARLGD